MKRVLEYAQVDAFADKPLSGNPCAVILNADSLTELEMLSIAKETNQSETAFLMKSHIADLKARYFTPEKEIPLAGHPTIASVHAALECGLIKNTSSIQLELNDGPITVEIETRKGHLPLIRMFQRKPVFGEIHNPEDVLPLFNLSNSDLVDHCPIQTVSTGTKQLMLFVNSHQALQKIQMDVPKYKAYRSKKDFFSPHIFALGGINSDAQTFARHPGVPPDTSEDAFTGSSTGGMACYLWKYGQIKSPKFIAEQGHWMSRPGRAFVEVFGDRENIETVSVAGSAFTVIKGHIFL